MNEFKSNFFISNCPCNTSEDTQEHALFCVRTRKSLKQEHIQLLDSVKYSDIFADIDSQYRITKAFDVIIQTRERLRIPPVNTAYLGDSTGPGGG